MDIEKQPPHPDGQKPDLFVVGEEWTEEEKEEIEAEKRRHPSSFGQTEEEPGN